MTTSRSKRVVPGLVAGLAVAVLCSLAACNTVKPSKDHAKEMAFYDFAGAMRWGDFNAAYDFVDPETKKTHPLTDVEKERFKLFEVSGYEVLAHVDHKETVDQEIKLDLINRNTQIPRSVVYHEHWRWDDTIKHWWLVSGLPDISPQQ